MITIPGKIPIRIHPLFWMLIVAIGWINSMSLIGTAVWAAVIFVSILIHEYGHALTAMAFGQKARIDLIGMGGLTTRSGKHLKLWQEFLVVLNGPLAGISLYFLALFVKRAIETPSPLVSGALQIMIIVNLFWTLLNLLPIQPLDGGRLFSIILEKLFGLKGIKAALFLSMCLAGALGMLFFYSNDLFAGSIFMIFMFESYRGWRSSLVLAEHDRSESMQNDLKDAERDMRYGNIELAVHKLETLRNQLHKGVLYLAATQHLAKIRYDQHLYQVAYELLKPVEKKLDITGLETLQQAAYQLGLWNEALNAGTALYRLNPDGEVAFSNALCSSKIADNRAAKGWLQTSRREGLPDLEERIKRHPELENLDSEEI